MAFLNLVSIALLFLLLMNILGDRVPHLSTVSLVVSADGGVSSSGVCEGHAVFDEN
jgi:hypothetical protein